MSVRRRCGRLPVERDRFGPRSVRAAVADADTALITVAGGVMAKSSPLQQIHAAANAPAAALARLVYRMLLRRLSIVRSSNRTGRLMFIGSHGKGGPPVRRARLIPVRC